MSTREPTSATSWVPLTAAGVAELLGNVEARWWLSGGAALDHWLGRPIRQRTNIDVSTTAADLPRVLKALPSEFTVWAPAGKDAVIPLQDAPMDADLQPLRVRDERSGGWALQVNVEDGTDRLWVYRRDPRLQVPWERAVIDVDRIPTGAPEVQLIWKALRPRPQDDLDKDAVLPKLSEEARGWFERSILSLHPHSTWSIHVRSPFAPAKASWNRGKD